MIRLLDLISLCGVKLANYKIHCATGSKPTPLEAFFDGKFKQWQEGQNQRNFECAQILSLIHMGADRWLFVGVYSVEGIARRTEGPKPRYMYATSELRGLEDLVGRAVVQFDKTFRASYLRGSSYGEKLAVSEIRRERLSVGDFPGYNAVLVSRQLLRTIIREEIPSWRSALSSVSGVYLIVDTTNGKQYVGSASGVGGIWQRWDAYARNGHGGNKDLVLLLDKNGAAYADNFQYSILEVSDLYTSQETVLERETHWKKVLCSGKHGYN
jgi:GIY-YIG catalytic domain